MRFLLEILLTLFVSVTVFGQDYIHQVELNSYYDRVSHDYIKFKGLQKENLLYKGAPSFQINYTYNINPVLSAGTGIGYSKRGFTNENMDYSSTYLQIPLRLGVEVYYDRYIQIIPYGGGYVGIPLKASKTIKDNYFSTSIDNKNLDIGLETGVNFAFKLSDEYNISLIPRFQFGLSNIYQGFYYERRRNIAFSLGIGIIRKI